MVSGPHSREAPGADSDAALRPARLIQSFASTLGTGPATDLLRTREEAAAWLHTEDLLPPEVGLSNSDHAALLRLRESIRDLLTAQADGRDDPDAAARLTRALADGRLVLTVGPAGAVGLASAARANYANVVATMAVAIAEAAATGAWPGLKVLP
ncbi:MAG TPA: ABATE domain-containing protein [Streptosporangiaceae bacterium]|nr:ABATE domain-containing protein [Streptosporangiaceae bacterium]